MDNEEFVDFVLAACRIATGKYDDIVTCDSVLQGPQLYTVQVPPNMLATKTCQRYGFDACFPYMPDDNDPLAKKLWRQEITTITATLRRELAALKVIFIDLSWSVHDDSNLACLRASIQLYGLKIKEEFFLQEAEYDLKFETSSEIKRTRLYALKGLIKRDKFE